MKSRHHYLFLLTVLLCVIVLAFSSDIRGLIFKQTGIDTIGHLIGFFCLSLLLNSIFKFPLMTTVVCLTFYAALSEIGQYYLGFRNGEFRDFVADVVGILFFALMKWIYTVYWRKSAL